jgi:hypothetical protein
MLEVVQTLDKYGLLIRYGLFYVCKYGKDHSVLYEYVLVALGPCSSYFYKMGVVGYSVTRVKSDYRMLPGGYTFLSAMRPLNEGPH